MVAGFLGVNSRKVRAWVEYKWLKARFYHEGTKGGFYVIDALDLQAFLHRHGAIMTFAATEPIWVQQVAQGRREFYRTFIASTDVAALLGVVPAHLAAMTRDAGLPPYEVFANSYYGECYYRKTAVADWLDTRPDYDKNGERRRRLRCT